MPEKSYIDTLTDTDTIRVRFFVEQGIVIRFVVQYEAVIDGERLAVLGYDRSHDQAHRDILDRRGETIRKEWLGFSYGDALTFALHDIRANWQRYRRDFVRSK